MFIDSYINLLILQYSRSQKAIDTVTANANKYEELYNVINDFNDAFDIDTAVGAQLDIIGKIVGLSRVVNNVIPKVYFGFSGYSNTLGFGLAPFYRTTDAKFSTTELNDYDYKFFLKAKIAKNVVTAKMINSNLSIQDAISFMFGIDSYITDNKDMTMTLYIDENYPMRLITYLIGLNLIPRPQGVDIKYVIIIAGKTFGFSNNPNSLGFGLGKFAKVLSI